MSDSSRPFKAGDSVCALVRGTVTEDHSDDAFPICVDLMNASEMFFTADGKELDGHDAPILFHANSGVVEVDTTEPLPDVMQDMPVWVRRHDKEPWIARHATGQFVDGRLETYNEGTTSHTTNYSFTNHWKLWSLTNPNEVAK